MDMSIPPHESRLFMNGRNLAARIPRSMDFGTRDITIRPFGNGVLIEPRVTTAPKGSLACMLALLATMEPIDDEFPDVDEGLLPLDDIYL